MAKGKISEFVPENVSCAENRSESPDLRQFGLVMSEPYRVAIRDLLLTRGEVKVRELEKFDLAAMTRMLLDHSKMLQAITNNRDIPLQSEVIR